MKSFIGFRKSDGVILVSGTCPQSSALPPETEIMQYMEYGLSDETHVIDGTPVRQVNGEDRAEKIARLRVRRNRLLSATDWTQLNDIPSSMRQTCAAYRQQLRDLPEAITDSMADDEIDKITWPTPPSIRLDDYR